MDMSIHKLLTEAIECVEAYHSELEGTSSHEPELEAATVEGLKALRDFFPEDTGDEINPVPLTILTCRGELLQVDKLVVGPVTTNAASGKVVRTTMMMGAEQDDHTRMVAHVEAEVASEHVNAYAPGDAPVVAASFPWDEAEWEVQLNP